MAKPGRTRPWVLSVALVTLMQVVALPVVLGGSPAAHAATASPGAITLHVQSARSVGAGVGYIHRGDAVTSYKWLIAAEDVGNPDDSRANCLPQTTLAPDGRATDPSGTSTPNTANPTAGDHCQWPSVRYTPGAVPVVAQGTSSDLNDTTALDNLPAGRYLVSVTADGYKLDGAHFTVNGGTQRVTVDLQPSPLPLGTVRMRVFNDSLPVDATYEVGAEKGLAGFHTTLSDVLGTVSTDYYGNPLCTKYMHDSAGAMIFDGAGKPVVDVTSTGQCVSDVNGDIVIPNLGPDRYTAQVIPPTGTQWVQTTTLEGAHDHDIWVQEGATGFDTEQTVGGERVPAVDFGFVAPTALPAATASTGEIKGTAVVIDTYVGGTGGVGVPNAGVAGASVRGPVSRPWVSLSDLGHNDQMVYTGRGAANGTFDITGVPVGSYQLTLWDDAQDLILDSFNVTVNAAGEVVDVGQKGLVGWHADVRGSVYIDANGNGRRDAGETGVPDFAVAVKSRDNSLLDQGLRTVSTDATGHYDIPETYPLSKFLVLEAFNTRYKTTGITYQADNQPDETTLLGSAVDVSMLPIIGLSGRVDWGVVPYDAARGENGGIVGTVTYDTTRNELDPKYAVTEPYQPGIPGIGVHLYLPKLDANNNPITDPATGAVQPVLDGAGKAVEVADTATSETWNQPKACTPRLYNGDELVLGTNQSAVPYGPGTTCVESPMSGWQIRPSETGAAGFGQTVNGNYGFTSTTINLDPRRTDAAGVTIPLYAKLADFGIADQPLPNRKYLVSVDIPKDPVDGRPMYQVTKEEDVNVFDGDGFLPQENFPPTPALASNPPDPTPATPSGPPTQGAGERDDCAGPNHTVHVTDAPFIAAGGSPFEGNARPLCDSRVVAVTAGKAAAPNFNLFTPVPLPTHFWGLTINDLGLSNDQTQIGYGEAQPLPGVPMGIYDWSGRLVDTVKTDYNGMYEALEPSTSTYNCPLPAGPCPGMYRFVGNDPGQPGQVNANYNPRYRTIATNFQAWPGLYTVTDTAPTQVGVVATAPGSTVANAVSCNPSGDTPQVFAVSKPYLKYADAGPARQITIQGTGFGSTQGTGKVAIDAGRPGDPKAQQIVSWTDTAITFAVDVGLQPGLASVSVTAGNGRSSVNGLSLHVLSSVAVNGVAAYSPRLLQVNPPAAYAPQSFKVGGTFASPVLGNYPTVQAALDKAAALRAAGGANSLVVVWPAPATQDNPRGEYRENLVVSSPVRLQGVGPGGFQGANYVAGSSLDGLGFNPDNDRGQAWVTKVGSLTYAGPRNVPDAAVVTVVSNNDFGASYFGALDGFTVTGGAQADFATNINAVLGGTKTPAGAPGALITQGGGIYLHAAANNYHVTNNVVVGNSGSYGGGVRVGSPYGARTGSSKVVISHHQVRDNGGTNLAGAIGLFAGSTGYSVDHNDLCGNFSAEYGGAISHYGLSNNGVIASNRVWFNQSYDEGGGIMIAGELPSDVTKPSTGSGQVTIDANLVQDNLANDDGGGIRFLQAGTAKIRVTNNMVVNNVSTHEGGGFALDDSTNVQLINNTVMKNITTATAVTSDGKPAPAGLSTAMNSDQLQATLGINKPTYSKPLLLNNIFADNRAGSWNGQYVSGIGSPQAPANDPIRDWELGSVDAGVTLTPTFSVLQQYDAGVTASATNLVGVDPGVQAAFDVSATIETSRTFPSFRQAVIVARNLPPQLQGNYHLRPSGSPASNAGAGSTLLNGATVLSPTTDIDGELRSTTTPDIGADEIP